WIALMRRLGYPRFVAQGGDWGAQITELMGAEAPPELLGIHSNMPGTIQPDVSKALVSGGPAPSGLSADESRAWDRLKFVYTKGIGDTRPRWRCARRRCTGLPIRPSLSPPGCSTTTRVATRTS